MYDTSCQIVRTYISLGYLAKADVAAVLNDGLARATQIHIDMTAVMHAELVRGHDDDRV